MDNHKDTTRPQTTTTTTTTKNRSMSDTDDEFHSPLRSPLQLDEFPSSPSKAIVPVDKCYTSFRQSPISDHHKPPQTFNLPPTEVAYNRSTGEEPVTGVTKVNPGGGEVGGERRWVPATATRLRREVMVDRVELGFRVLEIVFCIIAFAIMASDKTEGWSGDSFDRYKEYRYWRIS